MRAGERLTAGRWRALDRWAEAVDLEEKRVSSSNRREPSRGEWWRKNLGDVEERSWLARYAWLLVALPVLLLATVGLFQYRRSLPLLDVTPTSVPGGIISGTPPKLAWPAAGAAALAVDGLGSLGTSGGASPAPIASIAKMMTAYVVLHDHPLALGEQGPSVTVTSEDVANYNRELADDQSVVAVQEGEQLSELQLLQGMLIPSGNNFAELLARWDAGSQPAFVQRMNQAAQDLGLRNTRYVDASGDLPGSVSTPQDLVTLLREAMKLPAFAQVVGQSQAKLPVAGTVTNTNLLLGTDGVIGGKTGWTDQAGHCLAFVADVQVGGRPVRVYGAVLGQSSYQALFTAAADLLTSAVPGLSWVQPVRQGQEVAALRSAWGGHAAAHAGSDASLLGWPGMPLSGALELDSRSAPVRTGERVGWLRVTLGEQAVRVPVVADGTIGPPGFGWRVIRP